jgi:hypothetical protein
MSDWKKNAIPADGGDWKSRAELVPDEFKTNAAEAAAVGGLQGMTSGFADEAYGALQSPAGAFKKFFGAGENDPDVKKYARERDTAREAFKATGEQHPVAKGVGQAAGAIATSAALPGSGAAKLVGLGVADGIGNSNADNAADVTVDGLKGGAVGAAAAGAGALLKPLGSAIKTGLEEVATNPTVSKIAAANPSARVLDAVAGKVGLGAEDLPGGNSVAAAIAKRAAGHFVPGVKWAQGASDAAAAAQKGAQVSLDTINALAPKLGRFGPVLEAAAQRGASSFATTQYMLSQQYPEYRDLLDKAKGEGKP